MAIFTGVFWILITLLVPETYAPYLLRQRAQMLSERTGRVYISLLDAGQPPKSISSQLKVALTRPWILLFKEPIVLLLSIYIAIIYGTLYMCFAAFPIVFQVGRGWSPGIGGLAFIGTAVGVSLATLTAIFENKRYVRLAAAKGGMLDPEARLRLAMLGSIFIPIGLFWFAWTTYPSIHWAVPIVGSVFFGLGLVLVFLSLLNYLIDSCKLPSSYTFITLIGNRCGVCCFGLGRQFRPSISLWCSLSSIHATHVRESRCPMGRFRSGVSGSCLCSIPVSILQIRPSNPTQVPICL
jgi:hypothetical protein